MNMLIVLAGVAAGLLVGLIVFLLVLRQFAARQSGVQQAAVAAAVSAAMQERGATAVALERDREATVTAAVSRAAEVAESKLDARLRQSDERYQAGSNVFEKRASDINQELRRMQTMVDELQRRAASQHGAVVRGLEEAAKVTKDLQSTTGGLKEALANPKARGQWGERMAEDVLRAAGFKEGINFHKQKSLATGRIPDITFTLPHDMEVHMDVKFPVDNYLRFLEVADTDRNSADEFRAAFRRDVKNKVTDLASRRYAEASTSVDYVILFMPNESVFSFVNENDPQLVDTALANKIVICGPSTLFAVLAIIRQAMDNFMLERRGEEILACLTEFSAEWTKYSEQVDKLGKHMETANRSFEALSSTRTNQLERKLRKVDQLRASDNDASHTPTLELVATAPAATA